MNIMSLTHFLGLRFTAIFLVLILSQHSYGAAFVLGKQYLLKPKRQTSSLVWYAVTFDKSVTSGLKVTLKVFSEKGKSLEFLDEYRDFVASEIADRCISKFSMTNYRMDFNTEKRTELAFEVKSVNDINYIPLKVKYEDGFEDYLVRIRVKGGKFAISTRPLQHGMLSTPEQNVIENYRAEQEKEKQKLKKQEEQKKAKLEAERKKVEEKLKAQEEAAIKAAPKLLINEELFNTDSSEVDNLLKNSESEFKKKEEEAKSKIVPGDDFVEPVKNLPATNENTNNSLNNLFDDAEATKAAEPAESIKVAPVLEAEKPVAPPSPIIKESPKAAESFDDEIEIEGFDEALDEIERLENLEKK